MARRLFFVDEVRSGHASLRGGDAHHLTRVLRVEPGQKFEISDNANLYLAEVQSARKDEVRFSILEKLNSPPTARALLFAALIRFERFEWLIEKATELGAASIQPFAAERSEKGLLPAASKRAGRWRRIAREASEQCRRPVLPELLEPCDGAPALPPECCGFLLDEDPEAPPILDALLAARAAAGGIALCVGPEGGWTGRERAELVESGWKPVSLGEGILRAETAAAAGLAIVNAVWNARTVP